MSSPSAVLERHTTETSEVAGEIKKARYYSDRARFALMLRAAEVGLNVRRTYDPGHYTEAHAAEVRARLMAAVRARNALRDSLWTARKQAIPEVTTPVDVTEELAAQNQNPNPEPLVETVAGEPDLTAEAEVPTETDENEEYYFSEDGQGILVTSGGQPIGNVAPTRNVGIFDEPPFPEGPVSLKSIRIPVDDAEQVQEIIRRERLGRPLRQQHACEALGTTDGELPDVRRMIYTLHVIPHPTDPKLKIFQPVSPDTFTFRELSPEAEASFRRGEEARLAAHEERLSIERARLLAEAERKPFLKRAGKAIASVSTKVFRFPLPSSWRQWLRDRDEGRRSIFFYND